MVMAIATMHDEGYNYLYPYTWNENGLKYCELHDYPYVAMTDSDIANPGYAKIDLLLAICNENPDVEWILWKDCDSLITNFNIRIEDVVDNEYHVLLTTYWNGINAGMMMVRNSIEGRKYLEMIMSVSHLYPNEQEVMIDTFNHFKDIIKIVPQRTFNAACFSDGCHGIDGLDPRNHIDCIGTNGQWQPGDWVMHWPGQSPQLRLQLVQKYLPLVLKP